MVFACSLNAQGTQQDLQHLSSSRMDSYFSLSGTSTKLRPTGLDPLAGCSNGHNSAPLPAMDTARPLHSLASHDNRRRSTPRNTPHVAGHGDDHDSTPLLFITNSFWPRTAHCQTVTNVAISLLHSPPIKRGPQIHYSLSSNFYLKTLLKFLFEHSILVEAEN